MGVAVGKVIRLEKSCSADKLLPYLGQVVAVKWLDAGANHAEPQPHTPAGWRRLLVQNGLRKQAYGRLAHVDTDFIALLTDQAQEGPTKGLCDWALIPYFMIREITILGDPDNL